MSDIHYEQPANRAYLKNNPLRPIADTLLIAGDLMPLNCMKRFSDFLDYLSSNWKSVIWIPGNHEFYSSDLSVYLNPILEKIRNNIHLCHRSVIKVGGLNILGCTLWSYIDKAHQFPIKRYLQDFSKIHWKNRKLDIDDYNIMHELDLKFLEKNRLDDSSIVITHHVPTLQNYPEKYKGSILNQAFASENNLLIKDSQVPYWIYGHHHANTDPFKINNTTVVTNQLGYVLNDEHLGFNASCTFTL
ncbi:metallophosphoesterase [Nonlabens spongiae]|uniref:metallophosphoesterase n=1 Tax=Nonlabens spongiae TaxID=331648 RepID=UPI00146AB1DB|nr:metallophosphoesterase [Nonlabens spongiae]